MSLPPEKFNSVIILPVIEAYCENCSWFKVDKKQPADLPTKDLPANTKYGKCLAEFVDNQGKTHKNRSGTLSNMPCFAKDDQGHLLFFRKPSTN